MKIAVTPLLLYLVLLPSHGQALISFGAGGEPCGTYLKHRGDSNAQHDAYALNWFAGYVDGFNRYAKRGQIRAIPSNDNILAWLDKGCREMPLASLSEPAEALIELRLKHQK